MSSTIDILPFITPLADPSLSEMDFSTAVDDWNESLSKILKLNTAAFWDELFQNHSLSRFLNSFLGEYGSFKGNKDDIWIMELEEVVRRVFMIYRRIAASMDSPEATAAVASMGRDPAEDGPGSDLVEHGLVSTSVLMDLAGIYGGDPEEVGRIISTLLQHTPELVHDFRTSAGTVVQIIRRVQKKFEKGVSGGAGKGKGKGKGVASPTSSPEPAQPAVDEQKMAEAAQYGGVLLDIAYALDAVSRASSVLARELQEHTLFLQCLSGCYNYTLPVLSKTLGDGSVINAETYAKHRVLLDFLRLKMLSLVNNIIDGACKQFQRDGEQDESLAAALTDEICSVIMDVFEQTPLEPHMVPMMDAPMILDLEIQFNLSEKLNGVIQDSFGGENDRIHNLAVMLCNLREFNTATETYIDDLNMRRSEKMAREMSSLYISGDREHSTSTITSDPHHGPGAFPAEQDEDYIKRTMLISQLQDLFPDLGDGFLEACLIAFQDDPEVVTMKLLDEDLPSELAVMDRSTARSAPAAPASMALVKTNVSEDNFDQDVLSTRRNIFDGDAFDMFSGNVVDKSKVSRGKRGPKNVDDVLDDKSFVSEHKGAILQALDNMYDDEYDDTYDSMGLNNTGADFKLVDDIDAKTDEGAARTTVGGAQMQVDPSIVHEEVLINLYMGQKDVFNRSAEARRSKKRQELRNLTKLTDEQLEGWAIMFGRNPRKESIARKYEFSGNQTELGETEPIDKRRGGRMPFVEKNTALPKQQQQQGSGQNPPKQKAAQGSRPQQQQSKGSQPPSSSSPQPQALSQQPKQQPKQQTNAPPTARDKAKNERQKSSKANHNRKNQHAKKMASMNP